jgi:hypothetical protein
VREGTGAAVACNCVFVDAPTDFRFDGDFCTESARVNIRLGAELSVSFCVLVVAASGRRFEGDILVGVVPVVPTSSWGLVSSSSSLSKSNIFANPRLLLLILGVSTKISTSLVPGVGVASGSPVSVSMTPFIADATGNAGGAMRSAGVSNRRRVGRVGEVVLGWGVFCGSVVSCASGARIFFTSSSGVLSFFCPVRDVRARNLN